MSVYVGKDVTIVIQNPVEEDVSSQADGANSVFTVSKKPISDRDLDGVADEPAHVTVYVNGIAVTVNAVDDDQGQVTLASLPAQGSAVIIEYRYDLNPEVAQEITLEPKQSIEGIDGLGSDTVQLWALLLKEITGSIKEVFRKIDQFKRVGKHKLLSKYSQQFWNSDALNDFDGNVSSFTVDSQELLALDHGTISVKNSVVPYFRDGVLRCKIKRVGGDCGWVIRRINGEWTNYRIFFDGGAQLHVTRVKPNGETADIFVSSSMNLPSGFFPVEIKFVEDRITVDVNDGAYVFFVVDSDPLLNSGGVGFYSYFGVNGRWDDFQIWSETAPDEYGMVVKWDQSGSAVRLGLDKIVFPEGSIPSPKNSPVFIVTPFKAQTIKTIT